MYFGTCKKSIAFNKKRPIYLNMLGALSDEDYSELWRDTVMAYLLRLENSNQTLLTDMNFCSKMDLENDLG